MSEEKKLSCIDCAIVNCIRMESKFPDFCPSTQTFTYQDINAIKNFFPED
ncbi:hypothetical protein Q5O24_05135 [Eubacteriaceae bacterium ES3]|nr:hypothetical protein Q5O24_05135 [Eubacteriaceae bacterium ES3]